jgi:hypothetical protein
MTRILRSLSIVGLLLASAAHAKDEFSGFLCCNMRSDGSWITDINYDENGKHLIPAGTPVTVKGYGHYRVNVIIDGKKQAIGNDYSRDLSQEVFAKRYVVAEDPKIALATYPQKIQDAILSARLTKGMTREQVLMSVGYPVSSENHNLDDKTWRFWLGSFAEFRAKFDDNNQLIEVDGDFDAKTKVWME